MVLVDVLQQPGGILQGNQVKSQENTVGLAGDLIPELVRAPHAIIQKCPQIGGLVRLPAGVQGLCFRKNEPQVRWLVIQPLGILHQAVPGGHRVGQQGMINCAGERHVLAKRAAAIGPHQAVGFDHRRQAELAVGIQQLDLADIAQVQPHRILGQLRGHLGIFQIDGIFLEKIFLLDERADVIHIRVTDFIHGPHVGKFVGICGHCILDIGFDLIEFFLRVARFVLRLLVRMVCLILRGCFLFQSHKPFLT